MTIVPRRGRLCLKCSEGTCFIYKRHYLRVYMTKQHDQKQLRTGRCISFYALWSIVQRSQGRDLKTGTDRCRGHGGVLLIGVLPMTCSVGFLLATGTTNPRMAPPRVIFALPHRSSKKKMPHRVAHKAILRGHLLRWLWFVTHWYKTSQYNHPLSRYHVDHSHAWWGPCL